MKTLPLPERVMNVAMVNLRFLGPWRRGSKQHDDFLNSIIKRGSPMDNNRTYYSHDAKLHADRRNNALLLLALSVGVGIGASVALMFAPKSAEKTRTDLTHGLEEGLEHGISRGHEILDPTVKRLENELAELRKAVEGKLDERRKA
jgi:gas vesicle protein